MRAIYFWLIAVFITLSAATYQRLTGPTYPKRVTVELDGQRHLIRFLRSHGGPTDAPVEMRLAVQGLQATIHYRRYPTQDAWVEAPFVYADGCYTAQLPHLPPAGKYEYYVHLNHNGQQQRLMEDQPAVIRFKGQVPVFVLGPHIFFMFFAMLLSNLAGIMAAFGRAEATRWARFAFGALTLGGLILGPVVQKYAFGDFWTGVPFGWDLTDNKTLIAFLAWAVAVVANRRSFHRSSIVLAAVVLLLVYSIPHSMFGSELNHQTGERIQGFLVFWGQSAFSSPWF